MTLTAAFAAELAPPWTALEPVDLGGVHPRGVAPTRYVVVEGDGVVLRCDLYPNGPECHPFEDTQTWRGLLLIGYGCHLYVVNLATRTVMTHRFRSYFGALTVEPGYCLVASGFSLYRLGPNGDFLWANRDLASDGVIVSDVEGDVINGRGECDPPGDWRPFKVRLSDGATISGACS